LFSERNYKDEAEEARRKQIFKETLAMIEAHNELYSKGLTTFTMGINQFADMVRLFKSHSIG